MTNKLFVSNLNYDCTEEQVIELFAPLGEVVSFRLIRDKFTGNSRGFGFMEMATDEGAKKAMADLNGLDWQGRNLVVKEQEERAPRPPRAGGFQPRYGGGDRGPRQHHGGGGGGYGGGGGGGYNDGGGGW